MLRIITCTKEGELKEPPVEKLPELLTHKDSLVWADLYNPTDRETKILTDVFKFHLLAVEDCLATVPNPKIDDYGEYLYMVIHGINAETLKRDELETHDLDIFLGKNYLVTFHKGYFRSIESVMERCKKNCSLMQKDPEFLMHKIIDALVDNYLPIIDDLGEKVDELEKEIFAKPNQKVLNKLFTLKKDILYLRRIIHPQREILRTISGGEHKQVCFECSLHFKDVYDHLFMISELIESYRDAISGAMEAYLSVVSNRLNEVMKVLTVIATILMPLTLITGIFGMNFDHMPFLKSPYGFSATMILMGLIALVMLWLFKRKGWW
ncbi:MAG: magnesium/cobalt transporter CorA [Deltaproteobacteria bacterium]|nr:magnesium/cobalt transporter CorA [Deltaproteobacteria bacterium]